MVSEDTHQTVMSIVNFLKFLTFYSLLFLLKFYFLYRCFNISCGMANSVDPDQTAPSSAVLSESALFAHDIFFRKF